MIKKMSAFVADIDGTLVNKGKEMLPRTRQALERLHEQGVLIGPASGRPLDHRTLDKNKEWGLSFDFDFAIGMNGGDLWDKFHGEEIRHFHMLDKDTVREILTFMAPLDINAIVYHNGYDHVCALRMDDFMRDSRDRNKSIVEIGGIDLLSSQDTGKIEVHYRPEKEEEIMAVVNAHPSMKWNTVQTYIGTVEFVDPHVNKGMGLHQFADSCNIPIDEIIGFGDMENDLELIREAGWGVCMKNGCEACKAAADDITEYEVGEDGVGRYLEDHWFNQ